MVLLQKNWLWLLALAPVLAYIFWRYLRHGYPVFVVSSLGERVQKQVLSPPAILMALRLLTVISIILALAEPASISKISVQSDANEADIVMALDVSKSMLIEDMKPNRLEALKDVLARFVATRSHDRLGVVLYAGESLYWCPLTKNYPFLLSRLNQMDNQDLADGTAIGLGLTSAVDALSKDDGRNKIIILLTDGENNTGFVDPVTAAQLAKRFKIKIYTIGIGHTGMASMPITDFNGHKTYAPLKVEIDEAILRKIAANTGGSYYNASDNKALQNIYDQISRQEKIKIEVSTKIEYKLGYQIFILIGTFLMLTEMILRLTLFRVLL